MDLSHVPWIAVGAGLAAGIALAAASGLRVFVPLLVASLAARAGALPVAEGFEWLGSTPALIAFGVATAVEVGAYYVPWLDNLLDSLATPAAVAAGTLLSAAALVEVDPWLRWTLATVVGGGAAGTVQVGSIALRGASSVTTGGLANPLVSTGELAGSSVLALLAVLVPLAALLFVVVLALVLWRLQRRRASRAKA